MVSASFLRHYKVKMKSTRPADGAVDAREAARAPHSFQAQVRGRAFPTLCIAGIELSQKLRLFPLPISTIFQNWRVLSCGNIYSEATMVCSRPHTRVPVQRPPKGQCQQSTHCTVRAAAGPSLTRGTGTAKAPRTAAALIRLLAK